MNKRVITIFILLFLGVGVFVWFQHSKVIRYQEKYKDTREKLQIVQEKNKNLTYQLKGKEENTEMRVKQDTEAFLQAFFVYDTSKGERAWSKIKPFCTDKALKMLIPAGVDSNQPIEKTEIDKTIVSTIDKALLYYTPVDATHANIFARVWQKTTINSVSSVAQIPLDIALVYDEKTNKWLVDEIKIQQALKEDGYIN